MVPACIASLYGKACRLMQVRRRMPVFRWLPLAFLVLLATHHCHAQSHSLDDYLQQALQNSPLLKDYRNQVASAQVDSALIRAAYRPQVTGSSTNAYAPVIKGYGYEAAITNGGNFTEVIGISKAFAGKRNLEAQFKTLQLQSQGILNSARTSEQDLKRTITTQYITAYGDLQQLNFTTQINELLQKEETVLKKLTEKNVYRQADYLTFLVTLQQQQLAATQLRIQFQNDLATLNYLSGIFDTASVNLQAPALTPDPLPGPERSVFFRQFTLDSLNLLNEKLLIDLGYKPKLSVFADGGFNSTLTYNPYKNFGTSFGLNLSVPIYDGRKRKLQYSKLTIAENTRAGYRAFATTRYFQQIAQLTRQLTATDALIGQINNQIRYSESLITVNARLLETGDVRIADLVIALNSYLNARNLLTQNTITRLEIINQINYWNR